MINIEEVEIFLYLFNDEVLYSASQWVANPTSSVKP